MDPNGNLTVQVGVELKGGQRDVRENMRGVAGEAGVVFGTRADGAGADIRGFTSETLGLISGRSADVQVTVCLTCNIEDVDGVDFGLANVDVPVRGGDIGGGLQLRSGADGDLNVEVQASGGVGTSQEVASATLTQTHDIMTPVLDALGELRAGVEILRERIERRFDERAAE